MAKTVLEEAYAGGDSPGKIVVEKGYTQITDSPLVREAVTTALEDNPKAVSDYLEGKERRPASWWGR